VIHFLHLASPSVPSGTEEFRLSWRYREKWDLAIVQTFYSARQLMWKYVHLTTKRLHGKKKLANY